MKSCFLPLVILPFALAQPKLEFWPGTQYDPAIPTIQKVLGYGPGERISSHANLMRYMEALAQAAPARMKVFEYARSWEDRKLVYAAIGSETNLRRLDAIKAAMQKPGDPRKNLAGIPAVLWLGYGVHGNEISSPDAALLTAYHLLAARGDKIVDQVLANVLVLIDPTQNPDGRDRFVHNFDQSEGLEPDASPAAAEHNEPWPMGRTNHYHFDLNRDWFAVTQPETRGRIRVLREWQPIVFVDLHEMGAESTYYFAPEAVPFNPHLVPEQKTSLDLFGKNNAKWFDQFGFSYFTREVYDAFYPGYGASWPSYYGGLSMTYENASSRGLLMRRNDDTTFHFRDTVQRHFVASISTAEAAAMHRDKLFDNFAKYRQTATEEGSKESVREFILPRRGDVSAVDKLAQLLSDQGVHIKRATSAFNSYPAGTYVIPLAQPAKRLIRTLLDADVPMEAKFLEEQERRRKKKLPGEIYDVTAWSLPLLYNVECIPAPAESQGQFEDFKAAPKPAAFAKASVAYLVPWGSRASAQLLTAALRAGLRVHSTDKSFEQNGRTFPSGTLIIKVKENGATLHDTMTKIQGAAEVVPTGTGWVENGVNFGSRYVHVMKRPAVAIAWDRPVSASSAGHARFVLERQFGYPVSVVRASQFATADLGKFQVIVLPDGNYAESFNAAVQKRLKDWVQAGGTLIGIHGAMSFLADPKVALLAVSQESLAKDPKEKEESPKKPDTETRAPGKILADAASYLKAIQADSELPDAVQGVIARARTDPDHWLTVGLPETVNALVEGRAVYTPIKLDKGVNAAVFLGADKLLASGYMWAENKRQLAFKPLVVIQNEGRGSVIGFTSDPNYRGYLDGLNVLFVNAVFRGPAHAR